MDIRTYLKESSLSQVAFGKLLGVSQGAVQYWVSGTPPTIERSVQIERLTLGAVTCEELRPDVDWAYLRGTAKREAEAGVRSA